MEGDKGYRAHVLAVPYPSQGHINPLLQFCKGVSSKGKGIKVTLANTVFLANSLQRTSSGSVYFDTISDGYDEGGFAQAGSVADYLSRMEAVGSKTLAELVKKHQNSPQPIDCIVYDPVLPWALEVAKQFGMLACAFFTQTCTVNYTYYLQHHGKLTISSVPGLHDVLEPRDFPSFISVPGSYPAYFEMVLNQFSNTHKADFIFVNTFYKLEQETVDSMSKDCTNLLTIGPTIPSFYLDNSIKDDKDYGVHLFKFDSTCTDWLNTKPAGSVVYVAFGSMANLSDNQMEELAFGLKESGFHFLWVVRPSEEAKLPSKFVEETSNSGQGLVVKWSPQLEVLSHAAVGCFFTHGGWNSTIEALSLGVPMIAMPQWTDQPTNSKLIEDVWKVGVRVKVYDHDHDEINDRGENVNGMVGREEFKRCIRKVMEDEKDAIEMKKNAKKWRELAIEAVSEGGTSDKNIQEFVSKLTTAA